MVKKLIVGCVVFAATSLFGMSLDELNSASKEELMQIFESERLKLKLLSMKEKRESSNHLKSS